MSYAVKNINKSYGDVKILEDISIDFERDKTICILGESGAGKTTLLNIIGGITQQDSGAVLGFQDQDLSFVFQEDRLIKWKSVEDNIRFVLEDKMDKKQIERTVHEYLELVNLKQYKNYYPKELSEGMRQRISILRAFVNPAKTLIMDEPFKSLDINNKQIVIDLLKKLRQVEQRTCILVTHDIDEALSLGDKIVIISSKPARVKTVIENVPGLDRDGSKRQELQELIKSKLAD